MDYVSGLAARCVNELIIYPNSRAAITDITTDRQIEAGWLSFYHSWPRIWPLEFSIAALNTRPTTGQDCTRGSVLRPFWGTYVTTPVMSEYGMATQAQQHILSIHRSSWPLSGQCYLNENRKSDSLSRFFGIPLHSYSPDAETIQVRHAEISATTHT